MGVHLIAHYMLFFVIHINMGLKLKIFCGVLVILSVFLIFLFYNEQAKKRIFRKSEQELANMHRLVEKVYISLLTLPRKLKWQAYGMKTTSPSIRKKDLFRFDRFKTECPDSRTTNAPRLPLSPVGKERAPADNDYEHLQQTS